MFFEKIIRGSYYWTKLKTSYDFYCYKGSKNMYFVSVRNIDGQKHSEHTVLRHKYKIREFLILELY